MEFLEFIVPVIVSVLAGIAGSMGIGGGGILLLYLTVFASTDQLRAQGINLLFFIPCAVLALVIHTKNKLVDWKFTLCAALPGIGGVLLGVALANFFGSDLLRRLFGGFLLVLGARELILSGKPDPQEDSPENQAAE